MEENKKRRPNEKDVTPWSPIPCMLTYGKRTKSGNILPTSEAAVLTMDVEYLEFVFCDYKNFELLRVPVDDVEVLEVTRTGLFMPKTHLLAVTDYDDEGSVLTFKAEKIEGKYRKTLLEMIDAFVEGLYFRRGNMWIRDEVAYEMYQEDGEE